MESYIDKIIGLVQEGKEDEARKVFNEAWNDAERRGRQRAEEKRVRNLPLVGPGSVDE